MKEGQRAPDTCDDGGEQGIGVIERARGGRRASSISSSVRPMQIATARYDSSCKRNEIHSPSQFLSLKTHNKDDKECFPYTA